MISNKFGNWQAIEEIAMQSLREIGGKLEITDNAALRIGDFRNVQTLGGTEIFFLKMKIFKIIFCIYFV